MLVDDLKILVEKLTEKNKKVASMESCTGGAFASAITNVEGSSAVFDFGAVTYSNDYKVKFGVNKRIIDKYSVYSRETAQDMSKAITMFTGADYGVGITGKLMRADENNESGDDDIVYICVFDKKNNLYYNRKVKVTLKTRADNKQVVVAVAVSTLLGILNQVKD